MAIPELPEIPDIRGSIVTTDAMGTQTAIAEKVIEKQDGCIPAVKENQKSLWKRGAVKYLRKD